MKKTPLYLTAIAVALSLSALVNTASATVAVTMDTKTGESLGNGPFTLGWSFTVNSSITVDHLGVFDDSQDGLNVSHEVGLWDAMGALLASTTVQAGTASTLINQWRYEAISGTTLAPGRYVIGAVWLDGTDSNTFPGDAINFATAAEISFDANAFIAGGSLADPTSSAGTDAAYFGPNFTFDTAVPEPSTFVAGALLALPFGLQGLRRMRNRK